MHSVCHISVQTLSQNGICTGRRDPPQAFEVRVWLVPVQVFVRSNHTAQKSKGGTLWGQGGGWGGGVRRSSSASFSPRNGNFSFSGVILGGTDHPTTKPPSQKITYPDTHPTNRSLRSLSWCGGAVLSAVPGLCCCCVHGAPPPPPWVLLLVGGRDTRYYGWYGYGYAHNRHYPQTLLSTGLAVDGNGRNATHAIGNGN